MLRGLIVLISFNRREIEDESTPLGRHFARCGYTSLEVQIIDCVKPGEDEAIFITVEGIWHNRLATFTKHGNMETTGIKAANKMLGEKDYTKYLKE